MIGDDEGEQARQRLSLVQIGNRIAWPVGCAIDGQRSDRFILNAERPAHRRMRRAIAALVLAHRQSGFGRVAIDQHRLSGRNDMAEHADAARQCRADDALWQIGAGRDLELIVTTFDNQRDRAAFGVQTAHNVLEDFLLNLTRIRAVRRLLSQRVKRADPGEIGDAAGGGFHQTLTGRVVTRAV